MPATITTPIAQFDQRALEELETEVAQSLLLDSEIWKHYDKCDLDPTYRACALAARAAVAVIIAHNIGQEVGK